MQTGADMELKESEVLEFKKSTSELKEAVISISSILNKHKKGELFFGVRNDGEVIGQVIGSSTLRDISRAISDHIEPKIYPSIDTVKIKGKSCIKIEFQGEDIPYHAYGRVYIRVADEDKQLSANEMRKVIIKKSADKFKWEVQISNSSFKDINTGTVKDYVKRANLAGRISFEIGRSSGYKNHSNGTGNENQPDSGMEFLNSNTTEKVVGNPLECALVYSL